ncbi:MAG TPA: HEAT repeat domain-containing protein [Vicinamibacterales bacterium]|nr:HEAT repeat domain-containing protein [Vicinamibacterales bacterium]
MTATAPAFARGKSSESLRRDLAGRSRLSGFLVTLLAAIAVHWSAAAAVAQTPRLSNGRLETHPTTNISRDVPALARTLTEPMWIGYAQPLIDGNHEMCDYWNNGARFTQSTDPIRLEPADFFFVMFRVENREITRIRTYSANCPLDAGGKPVHWFSNVAVNDSISYMKSFIAANATRRLMDSAVTVIALTEGQQALNELLTIARDGMTTNIKGNALFWLAQRAGDKAIGTITAAIENDPDTEVKKKAVFALSQLPKDQGVPLLIEQARTNKNPAVRKQAMFWLGQSKDPRALKFFEEILK